MFENQEQLDMTEKVLYAIKYFGFDKDPNLDGKIKFRCYYEVGMNMTEEERDIFWDILHEILNGEDIKGLIRKRAKDLFGVHTMMGITNARKNLDLAEKAIKK